MLQYLASSARSSRRKKTVRLLALIALPLFLVAAIAMSIASGGAATAAAACQIIENGSSSTTTATLGGTGAVGAITPLQVEQYWVRAGGPLNGAVTAASIAYAESADITDRLQGSLPSAPTVATAATPTQYDKLGYGLWQITPGSTADYNPAVNAKIAVGKYDGSLAAGGGGWSPWYTYDTPDYYAAIPAAQAAYAQLTAQGAGGVSPSPLATTQTVAAHLPAASPTVKKRSGRHGDGGDTDVAPSNLSAAQQAQLATVAQTMQSSGASSQCPNVSVTGALPTIPGKVASIQAATGLAEAPTGLPADVAPVIDKLIAAGNQIHTLPYIWGGGHSAPLNELQPGYDCSGSTSYILYKAGLLGDSALVSGDFKSWGQPGPGKYVTVFSNAAHVFIEVDGIVLDTAQFPTYGPIVPSGSGPRWQPATVIQAQINSDIADGNGGFVLTHPAGL